MSEKEPRVEPREPRIRTSKLKPNQPSPEERDVRISKALSYLLRHGAVKEKLNIDGDGYVAVEEILKHNRLKSHQATLGDIERIVANNDKQRFHLANNKICANQGHSLQVGEDSMVLLNKETIPGEVYHGTYKQKLPLIMQTGLNKMTRNHIHFTTSGGISGIRKSANVLIYIDTAKCLAEGIQFYQSKNGVILSSGNNGVIEAKYFLKIVDLKSGQEIGSPTVSD